MKRVILTPNPYRDANFTTVREAMRILSDNGMEPRLCLPFEVDRSFTLPRGKERGEPWVSGDRVLH